MPSCNFKKEKKHSNSRKYLVICEKKGYKLKAKGKSIILGKIRQR
jgi:hypothetical protein